MSRSDTADRLRAWALEAGFDRAGVARIGAHTGGRFLAWLADGFGAGMRYLERRIERRLDPSLALVGARSALCVALHYGSADDVVRGELMPRVARYARYEDYHLTIGSMLEQLAGRIEQQFSGCSTRAYVDTGPLLERQLAADAGLGAVGKNTNLLHPEAGSWFFLGQILTTLEVEEEPQVADICGSCSLCLEACPTAAFPQPYRLDASRCISYWTIEHRGPIPHSFRPFIDDWVFGCDICQEVCPVNDQAAAASDRLSPSDGPAELSLAELLTMESQRYGKAFRRSAMKRAKLEGLQRNVAVAMGNAGKASYVEPLAEALVTSSELVRMHAAWALGKIGTDNARQALASALTRETSADVRVEIESALAGQADVTLP